MSEPTTERAPLGATLNDWLHFDLVLGLGADLLPVVPDAGAVPTRKSKIKQFGKVPSAYLLDGTAHGFVQWPEKTITSRDIERWSADRRLSMCVRASAVRAIDVDVTDLRLAAEIGAVIHDTVGELPERMRANSPKSLSPFLLDAPLKKRIINTKHGRIELLGDGQQWLAAGAHESGVRYTWRGGLPTAIPRLTIEQVERLWSALVLQFTDVEGAVKRGITQQLKDSPTMREIEREAVREILGEPKHELLTTIDDATLADLRDALAYPPLLEAAADNSVWSEVGYALLSLGNHGQMRWLEFSLNAPNAGDGSAAVQWWGAHATQIPRSDFRHVFTLARQLGWRQTADPMAFPIVVPTPVAPDVLGMAQRAAGEAIASSLGEVPEAHSLCTDLANANRLRAHYGGTHLIVVGGKFYAWCGTHWAKDEGEAARCAARLSAIVKIEADAAIDAFESIMSEASVDLKEVLASARPDRNVKYKEVKNTDAGKRLIAAQLKADALSKWQKTCEMANAQNNALTLLRKLLTVSGVTLDASPQLITCLSGTIDLRTGAERPHDPKDYITHCCPVRYVNGAQAPRFIQFLLEITDEERSQFLQRWFGYCITGEMREQKLLLHIGPGGNGKSTLMGALKDVLGEYMHAAAPGLLEAGNAGRHPTEIADLAGRRLVVAHESDDGAILREGFMKQVTGSDALKARFMYGDFFEFLPTHKLQLSTNHKPIVRGQDFGIWRRLLLVWYSVRYGDQAALDAGKADRLQDTLLPVALHNEREGIFSWLIAGARTWYALGLKPPASVIEASEEYRNEQDRVSEFVKECCILDPHAWSPFASSLGGLYPAYVAWSKASGYPPFGVNKFSTELERAVPGFKRAEVRRVVDGVSKNLKGAYGLRVNLDGDGGGSVATGIEELL